MPGRSTIEAIHLLRRLSRRFRVSESDLHMVFIDLEKAYYKIPKDVLCWALNKGIPLKYVSIIKDMYEGVVTNVRTCGGTDEFPITIVVQQGSALSPFLKLFMRKYLGACISQMILIDETKKGINTKLKLWIQTLEARGV